MRFFCTFFLLLLATPSFASPKIVVSIAPIHSLVCSLTKGVVKPVLLLSQVGSPHRASLRPSQVRSMSEADLLIWIGPQLESFLTKPVAHLVRPQANMRLLSLKGLQLLSQRRGGFWTASAHHADAVVDQYKINPHIWLSPHNARQIAIAISTRLKQIDPQNSAVYQQNLTRLLSRIRQLERALKKQLKPLQGRPYLVFHDAYPYFEKAFSLNPIGSVRISSDRAPGARRLQQLRSMITKSAALCLFTEPQFSPALAQRLAAGSKLKLGVLDPLGKTADRGKDGWFRLMTNLANNLQRCLGDKPQ